MKTTLFFLLLIVCYITSPGQHTGTFTDIRDGRVYKTIIIKDQIWFAENLDFKVDSGCWAYNNDIENTKFYGYLYNYKMAQAVCPIGWHLPSDSDWIKLTNYMGGPDASGNKLKSTSQWSNIYPNMTDSVGFSALPGGQRDKWGQFLMIGEAGNWWTHFYYTASSASYRSISTNDSKLRRTATHQDYGLSIRCIKDINK